MSSIWGGIQEAFAGGISGLHGVLEPVFGAHAWRWAIIALTMIVRLAMTPLAIKQTRSMRAMQSLQPKVKAIQKKYKADRDLMRKDPELYKAKKLKMNEELTALYKEEGVNPAGGCLPLILQAPIFIALFQVLRSPDLLPALRNAQFYFFTPGTHAADGAATGLGATVTEVGVAGYLLIALMAGSMFWSQRQMMARNAGNADAQQMQQQKIMLYVMPAFLAFFSLNFPMGVLLYWVTTNVWTIGQQAVILREVAHDAPGGDATGDAAGTGGSGKDGSGKGRSGTGGSGKGGGKSGASGDVRPTAKKDRDTPAKRGKSSGPSRNGSRQDDQKNSHLPARRGGGKRKK